jgi:hypothetical protein
MDAVLSPVFRPSAGGSDTAAVAFKRWCSLWSDCKMLPCSSLIWGENRCVCSGLYLYKRKTHQLLKVSYQNLSLNMSAKICRHCIK